MRKRGSLSLFGLFAIILLFVPVAKGQTVAELREVLDKLKAYPEVIVFNGKVATMDANMTTVQAMAVRNKRIIALGTSADIRKLAGPQTEMIDAKGRTVLPGLIDSHTHPHLWGIKHFGGLYEPEFKITYLTGTTADEVLPKIEPAIRQRAQELGPGKWIIVHYPVSVSSAMQTRITRADLDRMAPNNPVFLAVALGGLTNTKAKEVFESDPLVGKDVFGLRIWYFLPQEIFRKKFDKMAEWLKQEMLECNVKYGITTVGAHIEPQDILKTLNMMNQKGDLPLRWAFVHRTGFTLQQEQEDAVKFYKNYGDIRGLGSDYLWEMGVGSEGWDKSSCTTEVAKTPERRASDDSPACLEKDHRDLQRGGYIDHLEAIKAGLRVTFLHSYRDKSTDYLIQMMQEAEQAGVPLEQLREMRMGLDHVTQFRPDQIPLLAKYGMFMVPHTVYLWTAGNTMLRYYDFERYQKWLQPLKSLVEGGGNLVISTDAHITRTEDEIKYDSKMLDWQWGNSIWPFLEPFISREIGGRIWNGPEAIDRITLIKGITNNAAKYVLREKEIGSLEVGKLGDFIVIDKDYFTIPEKEIANITNLLTVVGGKVEYRSPQF